MTSPVTDRKRSIEESRCASDPLIRGRHNDKRMSADGTDADASARKKRRKVNHACVYCRRSHMTCDLERPCARCVKRDIGHLCHDEPREAQKRSKSESAELAAVGEESPSPRELAQSNGSAGYGSSGNGDLAGMARVDGSNNGPSIAQPIPVSPTALQHAQARNNSFLGYDWASGAQSQFQDLHHLHPNYMCNTSEVNNEYNLLNDFLSSSLIDDGALYTDEDAQTLSTDPLLSASSTNTLQNQQQQSSSSSATQPQPGPPPQISAGNEISRPSSALPVDAQARDKFYMTAADPSGNSPAEDRLHKLLRAKYDAGMLKPFNYVKGYAQLNQYMERYMTQQSRIKILKQLNHFRPKFREAMHILSDLQLVMVEMWFERSLMEYDRVFASMAVPACCWRRTGEIVRGNREMAELIRVPMESLRDGRLAIHEIIAEDSLVSYWEKFGAIAFDQSQKAILTSCSLKSPEPGKENDKQGDQRCCFSFTIRRDTHNIPSLIVGNFLPIRRRDQS